MRWSRKSAIVCFHSRYPNTDADKWLGNTKGFVKVKHYYELSNSVLVEVKPDLLEIFLSETDRLDEVSFCERNLLVMPYGIHNHLGNFYSSPKWSCDSARSLHKIIPSLSAGIGVKIALADTGIAPHPYLPALSFTQTLEFAEQWHDNLTNLPLSQMAFLQDIGKSENAFPSPLLNNADNYTQKTFSTKSNKVLKYFTDDFNQKWYVLVDKWLKANLPNAYNIRVRNTLTGLTPLPPLPPDEHGVCGALRRISLNSKNFLNDDLCVIDNDGHGTRMAGIIAGRAAVSYCETDPQRKLLQQKYEPDVLGLAPFSELLILKCWDNEKDDDSNVANLVRAFEYALKQNADLIYCGIGISPQPGLSQSQSNLHFSTIKLLDYTISQLSVKNMPVVCPAGNDGAMGLAAPALCQGAISVTGVVGTQQGISRGIYSNWARPGENVTFCAFGGTEQEGLLTTNLDFGFTRTYATSVSAAIVAGLIARYLSQKKSLDQYRQYEQRMLASLGSGQLSPLAMLLPAHKRPNLQQLLNIAGTSAITTPPADEYGYGLFQDIP